MDFSSVQRGRQIVEELSVGHKLLLQYSIDKNEKFLQLDED